MASFDAITSDQLVCHNVLAHAETHSSIELKKAVGIFRNAEFDPTKFACVRVRYWQPPCTVSIFANGKLQATGAKDVESAKLALKKAAYRLLKVGGNEKVRFSGFKAENILATLDLGQPINLLGLSRDKEVVSTYEPTRFSGVVLRDPAGVTIDVFSTGKVNVKGAGSVANLTRAVNKVLHVIARHACASLD